MKKRLVVVGSINLDLVCVAPRIPLRGETLTATSFGTFGGKANQAVRPPTWNAVSMIGDSGTTLWQRTRPTCNPRRGYWCVDVVSTPSGIAQIITEEKARM